MHKARSSRRRDEKLAAVLMDGLSRLSRQLKSIKLPEGMTRERLSTLATIGAHDTISVTALAALENVRPATMSRMVSSLAADGFIRRLDDKSDGRGVLLAVTAKGRKAYERATQKSIAQLAEALDELTPEQLDALQALTTALDALQEGGRSKSRQ